MAGLVVKPRARIYHGHEWVYGSEVKKIFGEPKPGDVISLKDFRDRSLGSAIYNPESQIVARRFSRRKQDLDAEFFRRRIERAQVYRERLGFGAENPVYRLMWSESDGMPGLVVDRYGDQFVMQTLTLAMDRHKDLIAGILEEMFAARAVVERNETPMRAAEGLEAVKSVLRGEPVVGPLEVAGLVLQLNPLEGQKTGLYLDQLDNYAEVAAFAAGKRVLDCFCNQGGFALAAARAGAAEVLGIDASEGAVEQARRNAEAMGVTAQFEEANVFDRLRELEAAERRFDLIVLDPPSFTRNRKGLKDAIRGYKEIHLRALKLLEPGGMLSSFSCSHHMDVASYQSMLRDAAVDAKRNLRLAARHSQRRDHPILPLLPETEYLRGLTLEVMAAW